MSHSNGRSSLWLPMWRLSSFLERHSLPHVSHLNSFLPLWHFMCIFSLVFVLNCNLQRMQMCGFTPVCIFLWRTISSTENNSPHTLHFSMSFFLLLRSDMDDKDNPLACGQLPFLQSCACLLCMYLADLKETEILNWVFFSFVCLVVCMFAVLVINDTYIIWHSKQFTASEGMLLSMQLKEDL